MSSQSTEPEYHHACICESNVPPPVSRVTCDRKLQWKWLFADERSQVTTQEDRAFQGWVATGETAKRNTRTHFRSEQAYIPCQLPFADGSTWSTNKLPGAIPVHGTTSWTFNTAELMTAVTSLSAPSRRGFGELECPVCFETLSNQDAAHTMRSLPCRHSFCTRCAGESSGPRKHLPRVDQLRAFHTLPVPAGKLCSRSGPLTCPMCRQRHTPLVKAQLAEAVNATGFLEQAAASTGNEVAIQIQHVHQAKLCYHLVQSSSRFLLHRIEAARQESDCLV